MNLFQKFKDKFLDSYNMASGMLRSMCGDPQAWEASIRRFETRERLQPVPAGVVVFTGSSSITFWSTLEEDMAPMLVLNRGFGGSKMEDAVHYADRTVIPHRPRAVVLYTGTNDIAWPRRCRSSMDISVSSRLSTPPFRTCWFILSRSARYPPAGATGQLSVKPTT